MTTLEKMQKIEEKFGGGSAAADAIGVTFPTWWRWREGRMEPSRRSVRSIELLYDSLGKYDIASPSDGASSSKK